MIVSGVSIGSRVDLKDLFFHQLEWDFKETDKFIAEIVNVDENASLGLSRILSFYGFHNGFVL
jgi:hypothetical protein